MSSANPDTGAPQGGAGGEPGGNPPASPEAGGLGSAAAALAGAGAPSLPPAPDAAPPGLPLASGEAVPEFARGFSSELQEMITTKQYGDPEAVAQAYYHAEKKLGVAPDRLVELPSDWTNQDEVNRFAEAAGRPASAADYTVIDGLSDADKLIAGGLSDAAFAAGMRDEQWTAMQEAFQKAGSTGMAAVQVAQAEQNAADWIALERDWGGDFEANKQAATENAAQIGIPQEILDVLQDKLGTKGIMQWAHGLGAIIGEHRTEIPGGGGSGKFADPASAKAEYDRIKADPELRQRFVDNDPEVVNRVNNLVEIYSRDPEVAGRKTLT